jgi:hypothetical protein
MLHSIKNVKIVLLINLLLNFVARKCFKIAHNEKKAVYVDESCSEELMGIIQADEKFSKKFRERVDQILMSLTNREAYEKLKTFDTIWEIRLFKSSKGRNHRIYCKQIEDDNRLIHVIIVHIFLQKKTTKIPKEIFKRLKEIDKYEYEFE